MTGTDAVHSGDEAPMSKEMAESLSAEILGEMGLGAKDQADGADHGSQDPAPDNQNPDVTEGTPAGATPTEQQADGSEDAGSGDLPDAHAAWVATLPEAVQADLSNLNPDTVAKLREIAEGGLRTEDYTRKTQELARQRAEIESQRELVEWAKSLLSDPKRSKALLESAAQEADDPKGAAPEDDAALIRDLMKTNDPDEFAAGLDKLISDRVERSQKKAKESAPETKAARVNAAADQIHEAIRDKIPEGAWERACELYVEQCELDGEAWYETPVEKLAHRLRPHIRFAVAEQYAKQGSRGDTPQPTSQDEGSMSKPVEKPGPRAAAMPSSGSNVPTRSVPAHVREGREINEDEAWSKTMRKFGIAGEAELAQLRRNST